MRWTKSDTVGFVIAVAVTTLPPLLFIHFSVGLRKPGDPPPTITDYMPALVVGLPAAIVSSAIAWWFGGSSHGKWAIHGLVATLVLFSYLAGWCLWLR